MGRVLWAGLLAGSLLTSVGTAPGQEPGDPQPVVQDPSYKKIHPLSSKEEMIQDRFQRFEDRVYRLRELLAEVEPDSASRLDRVLQRTGELGLGDRLEEMITLLRDPSALTDAADVQTQWLADAGRILAILLERDSENAEREQAIERLQEYHDKIGKLLEQQRGLRDASAQAGMGERMAEQLDQAIQRIDALLERQTKVSKETDQAKQRPLETDAASDSRLGDRQEALSRDTAQLAEDLKRLEAMLPSAGVSPPAGAQEDEGADAPSPDSVQSDTKAAADSVQNGANSMSQAGRSLQQGDSKSAREPQKQAEEALREARERLEEAKRKVENQPESQAMAEEQQEVADETGDLSEQMQEDGSSGGSQGQKGGQQSSSSSPGQQSLDQAKGEMEDASEALGESKPEEAVPSQDRAIDQLEQAQKELEEALNQLRKEEREETLRDLEARFREMLSTQRIINDATIRIDKVGQSAGGERQEFRRAEQLQLADLSTQQRALAQQAATCLHILDEDGTTIAFPRVVEQLSEDMTTVADRLAGYRVGVLTQTIEREIVETLEQLLEAVQRMQQENEQQGGGQPGDGGDDPPPLLPPSAELKLLRAGQIRVNTRTEVIESERIEQTDSREAFAKALRKVATRQVQCAEIAQEMRDRQHQP